MQNDDRHTKWIAAQYDFCFATVALLALIMPPPRPAHSTIWAASSAASRRLQVPAPRRQYKYATSMCWTRAKQRQVTSSLWPHSTEATRTGCRAARTALTTWRSAKTSAPRRMVSPVKCPRACAHREAQEAHPLWWSLCCTFMEIHNHWQLHPLFVGSVHVRRASA